ncbi:MAG TPA: thrombospondin type 3 repeat-containing protein [Candidatus Paceibacterota bacterium]
MKISRHNIGRYILVATLMVGACFAASAANAETGDSAAILSAYQQYKDIAEAQIGIVVPTVVQVPFDRDFLERSGFAVLDTIADHFEPSYFFETAAPTAFSATSDDVQAHASALADNDPSTYASFDVPGDRPVRSTIRLLSARAITASSLSITLDNNVALPKTIAIHAGANGKVVVAEKPLDSTSVRFPQTRAADWIIELTHIQPLRIVEMRLVEDAVSRDTRSLRFLAQPNHSYQIYFNADRSVTIPTSEAGNLAGASDIRRIAAVPTKNNSAYIPADVDGDGIQDLRDNCVSIANPDQADIDQNGLGDTCQDFDNDRVANVRDNCPDAPNANQMDTDGDGKGDACDTEESRLTEKYKWIPWVGIGFAGLVIIALFGFTVLSKKEDTPAPSEHVQD